MMTPERYKKIYDWFSNRPKKLARLKFAYKWMPRVVAVLFGIVLLERMYEITVASSFHVLLPTPRWMKIEYIGQFSLYCCDVFVLCCGAALIAGSLLRIIFNAPRPYEQPGFVPLITKDTVGKSFPSRHALSAWVIALSVLPVDPTIGGVLIVLAVGICVTRVLAGVHHPRDVMWGAALGIVCGAVACAVIGVEAVKLSANLQELEGRKQAESSPSIGIMLPE